MKIEIKINKNLKEPILTIEAPSLNEDIKKITDYINTIKTDVLAGEYMDKIEVINQDEIIKIFAQDKKVYALVHNKILTLKLPLYEIEKRLRNSFLRISNSEIINVKKIKSIDLDFIGTICITLSNSESVYCSRRYVSIIRKKLGI
ncbi:DNA-binding LytR/AlgR family response regulator [Peptoniphilus olsenii]|uniref:DNA-binding LytR/AlgR family response regulator n=1 Tax=Peptoniphilus olsenii TaxID=411570 RepID=A0ABV2JDY7_9FIRM